MLGRRSRTRPVYRYSTGPIESKEELLEMPLLFRTILTASLMTGSVTAAQAAMVGLGSQDCGTWTSNNPARGGVGLFYQQWVFGFLSGASQTNPDRDPLKGIDAPAIMEWLDDYCLHHPQAALADAAMAFVQAHHP
jgi:hypothetical protein